jgi:hypothetical protein
MVSALGRAVWTFLSLEESVVAILYEGGHSDLGSARSGTAGGKESALKGLRQQLKDEGASLDILAALDAGIEAFPHARVEWRNVLSHAHPFTAGYEEDGTYLPWLGFTDRKGHYRTVALDANDLLEIAHRIEDAISPLGSARRAVRQCRSL